MKRLDLDDLSPKLAQLLTSLEEGEELLLVQDGMVAARFLETFDNQLQAFKG